MSRAEHVPVWVAEVRARTDKAALCTIDGRDLWIPLSAVEGELEPGVVQVAAWLVKREDLPEHDEDDGPPLVDPTITVFRCRPRQDPGIGTVTSKAFGRGTLLRVEGDKSVVRFADGKTRTLASRYLETA